MMADVSLAVLRERELLEVVKVASEIRVIHAAMPPAVRGILSDLSEAKIQSAEHVNSKCVIYTIPCILEMILHNTKRQRSRCKLTSMACLLHNDMDKEKDHLKSLNYL
ncbi:hypothetical protein CY35_06G014600 [Sphagnum magellanicum]|nr:hypothetical protein CY35_06G014600 [Sphagnum magellanicum]KAH9558547.1 hypothetical protein CY35_06G014600 [Sphagnum magellanicum]KAH9558548.1 hypothetical protein CY35_06G014600 [Sphagnum magellanicum]